MSEIRKVELWPSRVLVCLSSGYSPPVKPQGSCSLSGFIKVRQAEEEGEDEWRTSKENLSVQIIVETQLIRTKGIGEILNKMSFHTFLHLPNLQIIDWRILSFVDRQMA